MAMTTKQDELLTRAKAVLRILNPLTRADREAVANIVLQLLQAEERERMDSAEKAMADEKAAYADRQVPAAQPSLGVRLPWTGVKE